MAQPYQKEVLLREVVEFTPAWTYLLLATGLLIASELALAVPSVAFTIAGLFFIRSVVLFRRGWRVRRYQRNLTRLQVYRMKSRQLPVSQKVQLLGMGFEWNEVHTQRVYDLNLPKNHHYKQLPPCYHRARRMEIALEHNRYMQWLVNFTSSNKPEDHFLWRLNPVKPVPPLEGEPYLHAVGLCEKEQPIYQDLGNRVGHTLILGTTRVGKTRLAELLITQDIARGDVVIVIDPKGDADLMLRCYSEAKRAGREDDFYLFHLGYPEISAQYNPVGSFMRITEVATRIANQMPGEGQSAAFREFVWGYVNQISKGIVGIGETPSFTEIKKYSNDLEPLYIKFMTKLLKGKVDNFDEKIEKYTQILNLKAEERRQVGFDHDISGIKRNKSAIAHYILFKEYADKVDLNHTEMDIAQSLNKAFITDQQYLSKLVASLDPFLAKMTSGAVAELIAPNFEDSSKDVFDWGSIIQSGGIVYIGLDALSDQEVARAVGASMLADLTSQYGRIYKEGRDHGLPNLPNAEKKKHPPIRIHIDEGNEPADKSLIPSLNKAGGAGVGVTVYTQTSSDLEARLGSAAFANQMLGNFNTVGSFRVQDEATANIFTSKQRDVTVTDLATFSGSSDSSDIDSGIDFSSSTQSRTTTDKVQKISTQDLTQLPKGQFFCMMDGNKLFKVRVPWLEQDDSDIPEDVREVAELMRNNYRSAVPDWYDFKDEFEPTEVLKADGLSVSGFQLELKSNYSMAEAEGMEYGY